MPRKNRSGEMKGRILDAYFSCMRRKNLTDCSIREIAQEAGVPSGSVLYYFESKENLIVACLDRIYEGYIQAAHAWAESIGPEIDTFPLFFAAYAELMKQYEKYETEFYASSSYSVIYHVYDEYPKVKSAYLQNTEALIQEYVLAVSRTKLTCKDPHSLGLALIGMHEGFSQICVSTGSSQTYLSLINMLNGMISGVEAIEKA